MRTPKTSGISTWLKRLPARVGREIRSQLLRAVSKNRPTSPPPFDFQQPPSLAKPPAPPRLTALAGGRSAFTDHTKTGRRAELTVLSGRGEKRIRPVGATKPGPDFSAKAIPAAKFCNAVSTALRQTSSKDEIVVARLVLSSLGLREKDPALELEMNFRSEVELEAFQEVMRLCFLRWPDKYNFQTMEIHSIWQTPIFRRAAMALFFAAEASQSPEEKKSLALTATRIFMLNWSRVVADGVKPERVISSLQEGRGFGLSLWIESFAAVTDHHVSVVEGVRQFNSPFKPLGPVS